MEYRFDSVLKCYIVIAVLAVIFNSCCKHWCTGPRGDSIAMQTCYSTTVPCTSSHTSTRIPVQSVPESTGAASYAEAQAVLSTKRKRKFPGPAGALPKLVRNDMSNISLIIS